VRDGGVAAGGAEALLCHRHLLLTTGTTSLSFTTSSCSTWLLSIDMASKWVDGEWEVVGGGWGSIRFSYDNGYDKLIIKYGKYFNSMISTSLHILNIIRPNIIVHT